MILLPAVAEVGEERVTVEEELVTVVGVAVRAGVEVVEEAAEEEVEIDSS